MVANKHYSYIILYIILGCLTRKATIVLILKPDPDWYMGLGDTCCIILIEYDKNNTVHNICAYREGPMENPVKGEQITRIHGWPSPNNLFDN